MKHRLVCILTTGLFLAVPAYVHAAEKLTIPQIQGSTHISPHVRSTVIIEGAVTHIFGNNFIVRDEAGDGNDATSDSIIVRRKATGLTVGDRVRVEGVVREFNENDEPRTTTDINDAVFERLSSGVPLPPVVIGAAGRLPPTDILFISEHSADPENSGAGFYESLEGTYVQIDNPVVVGPTNDFGEFWVVADGGAGASGMNSLGGITATPSDANPERIQIQVTDAQKPQFQHALGDTFVSIEGYVTYDRGLYEIRLANTTGANPKAWAPEPVGEAQEDNVLTIAGYNVENLDPVIEAVDKTPVNDPDDDVGVGKFSSIAEHVVKLLGSPDIVALQEMQDNDGGQYGEVVAADQTLKLLIDAIVAAGGPAYQPLSIDPLDDTSGGQPGGNIRVAYLYNPARLTPHASTPKQIDAPAFGRSRLPLVASFRFRGSEVTVINVHLSSKSGSGGAYGAIQPPIDPAEPARIAQARAVRDFVRSLPADSNRAVVVLGDFNAFWYETPLLLLTGSEPQFKNLALDEPPSERISYVFDGNSQSLDHALTLLGPGQSATMKTLHVNSVQPDSRKVSDHDPKLVRITFQ
ncbi:endonuclease/exonuclease/phosphatase family protein [Mesorhizobium ventifaucium]|uniref:Endo/exonuclease/phosphatase domain-containing protein n=1 Tax=Mesorhizobium ventifaucium TaxID=666020 RepID=A0ABM9DCB4_9HYPH|nr:endonuclease/exonuclease/phosphatase family protein [Mesorhizobium ventifaucium]CAH2394162.1 Endo/exonuclease/phosphatase domain-containing protein [Mesorhizobium ventifaucium]